MSKASVLPQSASPRNLIVFGDSFSDNGFSHGHGFGRYSNGPVWGEYLCQIMSWPEPLIYAWGGAQTGYGNTGLDEDWSGFLWQIKQFQPASGLDATLGAVFIGINDFCELEFGPEQALQNTLSGLKKMTEYGFGHLLVVNLPDITQAPAYRQAPYRDLSEEVRRSVQEYNHKLETAILGGDGYARHYSDTAWYWLDTHALFHRLHKICAVTDHSWQGSYSFPHPERYLWWDDWHPMTSVHLAIANEIAGLLSEK